MIKLKSITLTNFASFVGEHSLIFPETGLWSLSGTYEDNKGRSNGAGKSTVLRAICYTMDFADLASNDLQSWSTDEPYSVELSLTHNDLPLVIYRSKTTYSVTFNGLTYKAGDAKEFIKRNLLSPELISFVTYRAQDSQGNFLSLASADKLDFLVKLLELDKFDKFIENSELKLKFITSEIERLDKENEIARINVFALKDRITFYTDQRKILVDAVNTSENLFANLAEPIETDYYKPEELDALKTKKTKLESQAYVPDLSDLNVIDTNIKSLVGSLPKANRSAHEILTLKQRIQDTSGTNKGLEAELSSGLKAQVSLSKRIKETLDSKVTCPQCDTAFSPGHQLEEVTKLEKELATTESSIVNIKAAILANQALTSLLPIIQQIEQLYSLRERRVLKLEEDGRLFEVKKEASVKQLEQEVAFFYKRCFDRLEDAKQTYYVRQKQLTDDIRAKNTSIADLAVKLTDLAEKHKSTATTMTVSKEKTDFYREQRDFWLEAISAIGKDNFIRLITEESLELITERTNEYLSKIPNTSRITVKFVTEKLSAKGIARKVINLEAYSNGLQRPYQTLSGGERCSINICVDSAIGQVIAERTGKQFGWLALDEGLDGMDETTKTESLQVLKSLAADKLVIVVDHTSTINANLDGVIVVAKGPEGSYFGSPTPHQNHVI